MSTFTTLYEPASFPAQQTQQVNVSKKADCLLQLVFLWLVREFLCDCLDTKDVESYAYQEGWVNSLFSIVIYELGIHYD